MAQENPEFKEFCDLREATVVDLYNNVQRIETFGNTRQNTLEIQDSLDDFCENFEENFLLIEDPQNHRNIGRCYRLRCDLILQTAKELFNLMDRDLNQEMLKFIKEVMIMLAIQVGRLTLHGFNGEDYDAEAKDTQSLQKREWPTSHVADSYKAQLESIWARLQIWQPACACQQCRRRNHHTVPS